MKDLNAIQQMNELFQEAVKQAGADEVMIIWAARKGENILTGYCLPESNSGEEYLPALQNLFWMMCTRFFGDYSQHL